MIEASSCVEKWQSSVVKIHKIQLDQSQEALVSLGFDKVQICLLAIVVNDMQTKKQSPQIQEANVRIMPNAYSNADAVEVSIIMESSPDDLAIDGNLKQ